jgi:methionyl-tRNA formyltransferase
MDEGLDTGPVLMAEAVPITAETTGESLHDQLAALAARLMIAALDGLGEGRLEAVAQAENGVTYATKIEREEGRLDWRQPAAELERRVRAFTPWPGAWFEHVGGRVKVLEACLVPGDGAPGTVLDEALTIATADGAIALTRVQRAGKASMAAGDFLRGFPIAKGSRLA